MDSNESRIIGKMEEKSRHTVCRLNRIEAKVDTLIEFKWKAIGFATFAAFVATMLVEIARAS